EQAGGGGEQERGPPQDGRRRNGRGEDSSTHGGSLARRGMARLGGAMRAGVPLIRRVDFGALQLSGRPETSPAAVGRSGLRGRCRPRRLVATTRPRRATPDNAP